MPLSRTVRRGVYAGCVIAGLIPTAGCSPAGSSGPAVDLAAEKAALLKRDGEWQAAVTEKKDAEKIVSFFTSDAVMFGSGAPTDGSREALMKGVSSMIADPSFQDHWTWSKVELSPDGRMAYLIGSTDMTANDASGHPVTTHARLINVWRKDSDGLWRCAFDAWVDDVPPGGGS